MLLRNPEYSRYSDADIWAKFEAADRRIKSQELRNEDTAAAYALLFKLEDELNARGL